MCGFRQECERFSPDPGKVPGFPLESTFAFAPILTLSLPFGTALDIRDENELKITATNEGDWEYSRSTEGQIGNPGS